MNKSPNPIIFLAMGVLTVLLGGAACYWQLNNNSDTASRIEKLKKEDKDEKALKTELAQATEEFSIGAEKLAHLEKSVSEAAYVPTLLKELEAFGKASGIAVTGVRPVAQQQSKPGKDKDKDKKKARKPYVELGIEVKGRGSYRSVMNFVEALQSFPKIVAARTMALVPKTEQNNVMSGLEVTIELRTYVFTPPVDKKEGDSKTAMRDQEATPNG
ncbi:MAG TPA: type 4a pilus biogenesis protein PilO [Fimbriimonadaceae bacterium]|nr:type 4a pilus biogenesis protein PilO [Fimbriimonadaceae bacterium]